MKKRHFPWSRLFLWSHVLGVIGFYIILWLRTRPRAESPAASSSASPAQPQMPFVSVVVPARNEERNIRRCVTSLLDQNYANFEVIVVDDDSTDETPRILDELAGMHPDHLWVLRLRALPPHWAGKPHAIHSGTQEARGAWLLFTDADTWHAPDAISCTVEYATAEHLDLLSLITQQELPGFWNKTLMPMAYLGIAMQYPMYEINNPQSDIALASGQFILMRRSVYDRLGGYARPDLRETLLDDRDLARVVKQSGYQIRLVDGHGLVHAYMYTGLRESWRGWRKNVFLGSRGGVGFTLLQLIGLPVVSIVPFVLLPLTCLLRLFSSYHGKRSITINEAGLATLLEFSMLLPYRFWLDQRLDIPWYYAFTHPLAGAVFEGILAQSTWRVLSRKGVDWRGRTYYQQKGT